MTSWYITNPGVNIDLDNYSKKIKSNKIVSKILLNRGIFDPKEAKMFIKGNLEEMYQPETMLDIGKASKLIYKNIKENEKIRVVGDYDVDGVMSTYILLDSLNSVGGIVDYHLPDRIKDGYGINKNIIYKAYEDGIKTIITCDNGISAIEEAEYAKKLGLNLIITDHHELPFKIIDGTKKSYKPNAYAIINPKNPECGYPYKNLCGASVVYKLTEYLLKNYFNKADRDVQKYLEYAGIATICDVVELKNENRIIAKEGIKRINQTKNIGLKALIEVLGIDGEIRNYHIGFIIGPSINAAGRLKTADIALELLLEKNYNAAIEYANKLKNLNDLRKKETETGYRRVKSYIESTNSLENDILVIYDDAIHESVAGIIAGKIKDDYYRPTIILTNSIKNPGILKGSARSINEYNMHDNLMKQKDLLESFGGHPLAAGLSLKKEKLEVFRTSINKLSPLSKSDLIKKYYIDLGLPIHYINFGLIKDLKDLEPFGVGNPKPVFGAKGVKVEKMFLLGKNKNVLKFNLKSMELCYEGILFNNIDSFLEEIKETYGPTIVEELHYGDRTIDMDILYEPSINEFRGKTSIQIIIENYRFGEGD